MAVKKPSLPKSFDALKPRSASKYMRDCIWAWWNYEKQNGMTTLESEEFYQDKMKELTTQVKSKYPETRRVYEQ